MRNKVVKRVLVLLALLVMSTSIFPTNIRNLMRKYSTGVEKSINWRDGTLKEVGMNREEEVEAQEKEGESLYSGDKLKSTRTGFVYSLVLPGAGEAYANSYVKAGVFLAAELGFWAGYGIYRHRAQEKTDEYRDFADKHWEVDEYLMWLRRMKPKSQWWWDDEESWASPNLPLKEGTHTSSDTFNIDPEDIDKNSDFYEMIGNSDWYELSWDDVPLENADDYPLPNDMEGENADSIYKANKLSRYSSTLRQDYLDMYDKADNMLSNAKYFIAASIANHLLSAFDAVWTIKQHNRSVQESFSSIRIRTRLEQKEDDLLPRIFLTYEF